MGGGSSQKKKFQNPNERNMNAALGEAGNARNFGMQGMRGLMPALTDVNDSQSSFNQFMGVAPQLQGLIQGAQSPLEASLRDQQSRLARQATQDSSSNLAGLGALYSGATIDSATRANAEAQQAVANQLGAQQINLFGSLAGQTMGQIQQGQLAGLQQYGNMYNQGLGILGQYGTPQFVEQRYKPGFFESGGLGSNMASAVAGGVGQAATAAVMSDRNLKDDIVYSDEEAVPGVRWATFVFKGAEEEGHYRGVIAQDVEVLYPDKVVRYPDGFLRVDYKGLGIEMTKVEE